MTALGPARSREDGALKNSRVRFCRAAFAFAAAVALGGASALSEDGRRDRLEPGEDSPGGAATTRKDVNRDIFSQSSANIGFKGEADFKIGNAIFRRLWVSAPASTASADGLGPLYNARGCQNCHLKDGRGHPPAANWPDGDAVSMLMRLSIPPETDEQRRLLAEGRAKSIDDPVYGGQLQDVAIQGQDAEGHIHVTYEEVPVTLGDGTRVSLRKPAYSITEPAHGPLNPKAMLSPRIAPQMIGLGLLEAVPEADIRAGADSGDKDGDGISGRTNEVWSLAEDRLALGRFGWKAGAPTVRQQSADAFAGDMGLSTPLVDKPAGDCTAAETACLAAPAGVSAKQPYEVAPQLFDLTVFYARNLAVPARREPDRPDVLAGKALFHGAGCAACHRPSFTTGEAPGQPHLAHQTIWPYADLLLHDMGEGLADHRPEGAADGFEWRTAPLWGLGLTETVSGHTFFLHDGRARGLEEAILWHGGEAQKARDAYAALDKARRDALLAFLGSL